MIKLSMDEIKYLHFFENKTRANVKDCIISKENGEVTVITKEGEIGLVIGKKGVMIQQIKNELGKEIHVYEHSNNPQQFIKNLFHPIKIDKIEIDGNTAKIHIDPAERKRAIGKNGKKINTVKELTERHHNITEIKVI